MSDLSFREMLNESKKKLRKKSKSKRIKARKLKKKKFKMKTLSPKLAKALHMKKGKARK